MSTNITSVRSTPRGPLETNTPGKQPCVFMDRDGVFNTTDGFVNSPEDLDKALMPGAVASIARLTAAGIPAVLVTNQGGIDSLHVTDEQNRAILGRLEQRVEEAGGHLDAIYYCPNGNKYQPPAGEIDARKPSGGMLIAAAREFGARVDLADSYMIGDMTTDIAAGKAADAAVTTVLVETGYGGKDGKVVVTPDHTSADLSTAVDWILSRESR